MPILRRRMLTPWLVALPCLVVAAHLAGCGKPWVANPVSGITVSGRVTQASGAPIPWATVSAASAAVQAMTDAEGHYSLTIPSQPATTTTNVLRVTATDFAPVGKRLPVAQNAQDFVLRPYDTVTTLALPTHGEPSVSATAVRGDANVTLTIPSDALVTSAGVAATGNATVRLTYWNPSTDLALPPGSLVSALPSNANVLLGLQSLGMVDIQIVQGNDTLQVAAGKHLNLEEVLPPAFQQAMRERPAGMHDPFLFYFDTQAGLWVLDGTLTYDKTRGMLLGELPHLTTWNFDDFENWNPPASCTTDDILNGRANCGKPSDATLGGCVSGKAVQQDGTPVANSTVRMWLFDYEHISAIDVTTDAVGRYCVDVGTRLCVPYGNNPSCTYHTNTVNYHLSAPSSPEASNFANPIPNACRNQAGAFGYATYAGTIQYYNDCGLVNDDATSQTGSVKPLSAPSQVTTTLCSYCDGRGPGSCGVSGVALTQACAALPDVILTPSGPNAGGQVCAVSLKLGDACTRETAVCCPQATICSDQICVPKSDPASVR